MKNIRIILAYDGTNYLGWQKTSTGPSIEAILQTTMEKILQEPVVLQAASRTDAGVHAKGQVVNFFTTKEDIDLFKLVHSLNCMLPKDIVVIEAQIAPDHFHPTLDNKGKEYHYHLFYGAVQYPHLRRTSWHYPQKLDISLMREAVQILLGTHDFSAFCNLKKNTEYEDYIRTITRLEIFELPDNNLRIEIEGNNFLYKMVRNIVGTLVYIGSKKIDVNQLKSILESGDRTQAGVTAPAHGLFLAKVIY
jgi:tRNA pseudouridine38-40 synthase